MSIRKQYILRCDKPTGPDSVHTCPRILPVFAETIRAARHASHMAENPWTDSRKHGDLCPLHRYPKGDR